MEKRKRGLMFSALMTEKLLALYSTEDGFNKPCHSERDLNFIPPIRALRGG
jgi:hypothetical protein